MAGKKKSFLLILTGIVACLAVMLVLNTVYVKTSTNKSCMSCHVHEDADAKWMKGMHHQNGSGTVTDCAACHLPPKDKASHFFVKVRMGCKDLFLYIFKNKEKIDWSSKSELDYAVKIVYNESCLECHQTLYPEGVSDDAICAHLHYDENAEKLGIQCISCHLDAGHLNPSYKHARMTEAPKTTSNVIYEAAAQVTSFENFTETVPGTSAAIDMIAIPGGEFTMGSPEKEPFRKADEGPCRKVKISPFFMAEVEVTWDQYWAFFGETMSEGRTPPEKIYANNTREDIDAVSGPTPPFGAPDQGWGQGSRPAITMTHYGAETFCQWLSLKTGRKYRLPTEAEWEYAARGGKTTPYYFEGDPKKFTSDGIMRKLFGTDTTGIWSNVIYALNSGNRTAEPSKVAANPFGLKNMLGNVMEYCSDWYAEDAYSQIEDGAENPKGPSSGTEFVVRGGCYSSDAAEVRCAARAHTEHDAWLTTDPQNPKSIWWYSDIKGVGFRVVCEVPEGIFADQE